MAAEAGLCLAWSETPEDTFCRVVAHIYLKIKTSFTRSSSYSIHSNPNP